MLLKYQPKPLMDFHPVSLNLRETIEEYRHAWGLCNSEHTFTNIFIWGHNGIIKAAHLNKVLYILLDYGTRPPFMFAPITQSKNMDYGEAVAAAADYFSKIGAEPVFHAVTGPLKEAFEKSCPEYELTEDRDNFDYVYRTQDLLTLSGKKYHSKRNHINQFTSLYEYEYQKLSPSMLDECLEVYLKWLSGKDVFEPGILGELDAIKTIITNMNALGVHGGCIRINGKLTAFALGERITPDTELIHIEKADAKINGLYAMINREYVEHECVGTKFINREEDMGLEGLRRAKLSYHPAVMIEKYTAKLRK
ncbi:MAG: hypothetical protein BWY11_02441 [Firmicutes bacterium ADurb.Bin182]|nr:MAG: hypothetical protein BWY11_02441 [Firmicutes bacterium ADurb.Bin182]